MTYMIATNVNGVGQATKRKKGHQQKKESERRRIPVLLTFCGLVALACAIFVPAKIEEYMATLRWGEDMSLYMKSGIYHEKDSSLFAASSNGVEDITLIFNMEGLGELFIGAADNRMKLWFLKGGGVEHTEEGTLQSILVPVDPKEPLMVQPINLYGRPEGVAFHPHGLYYLNKTSELFVVNHACGTEGDIVEIFSIEHINGPPHAKAIFKSTTHVPVPIQSLNDVVAVSSDEIFITQWLHIGAPVDGNEGVARYIRTILNTLFLFLRIPSSARPPIWRCGASPTKDASGIRSYKKEWTCAPVPGTAGRALVYNGIALSSDKKTLMTADSLRRTIMFFNCEDGGGLRYKEEIKLPFNPDNIEPAPIEEGRELFTVGVATFPESIKIMMAGKSVSSMEELASTGKVSSGGAFEFSLPEGGYKQQLLTFQNSLNCVSCAVKAKNGVLFLGSWYAPGVLVYRP